MSNKHYAAYEKAYMLYSEGKRDAAMKKLLPAAQDGYGPAEELLGIILTEKGQYEQAEMWLRQSAQHGNRSAEANLNYLYGQMENSAPARKAAGANTAVTTNRYVDFEYTAYDRKYAFPSDNSQLEKMFLGYLKAAHPHWKEGVYTEYSGQSSEEGQLSKEDFIRLALAFLSHPDTTGYPYEKYCMSVYLRDLNYTEEPNKSRREKYLQMEKDLRIRGLCGLVNTYPTVTAVASIVAQQLAKELMYKSTDNSWYVEVVKALSYREFHEYANLCLPVARLANYLFDVPLQLVLKANVITPEDLEKPFFKEKEAPTFLDVLEYLNIPVYEVFQKIGYADPYTMVVNSVLNSAAADDEVFTLKRDLPKPHMLHFPPEPTKKDFSYFKNSKGGQVSNYFEVIKSFSSYHTSLSEHGHLYFTCSLCELGDIDAAYVPDELFRRRAAQYADFMKRMGYPQRAVDRYLAKNGLEGGV